MLLGNCKNQADNNRQFSSLGEETDEHLYFPHRNRRLFRSFHGGRAGPSDRSAGRPGQLRRGRGDGRRRRQRQERRLDDQHQRGYRRWRALRFSGRETRGRALHLEGARSGLRARRSQGGGRRRRQRSEGRHQAQESEKSLRAPDQRRMDVEHAGHGRAETVPAQLQRLPHDRAHHEVGVRRRRLHADFPAHGRSRSGSPALRFATSSAAATAGRPRNGSPAST